MLLTIPRHEIVSEKPYRGSPMPRDYAARLSLQQIHDLVADLKKVGGADNVVGLRGLLE